MKNCNKVVNTCGGISPLMCTEYESNVNADSSLVDVNCKNGEEVIQDIYNQLANLDLSALGKSCLTYVTVEGKNIVKNVLLKHEEKICELEARVLELENRQLCDMLIGDCVDVSCLTDPCLNDITTFGQLLQALVTKSCEETP